MDGHINFFFQFLIHVWHNTNESKNRFTKSFNDTIEKNSICTNSSSSFSIVTPERVNYICNASVHTIHTFECVSTTCIPCSAKLTFVYVSLTTIGNNPRHCGIRIQISLNFMNHQMTKFRITVRVFLYCMF